MSMSRLQQQGQPVPTLAMTMAEMRRSSGQFDHGRDSGHYDHGRDSGHYAPGRDSGHYSLATMTKAERLADALIVMAQS